MPIVINGSGTVTGLSVGGLPDGTVDTDTLAADAVTNAKANFIGEVFAWGHMIISSGSPSFNKSSGFGAITDNGIGDFTIALSATQADVHYICLGAAGAAYNGGENAMTSFERIGSSGNVSNNTTTALRMNVCRSNDGSVYDPIGPVYVCLIHEG